MITGNRMIDEDNKDNNKERRSVNDSRRKTKNKKRIFRS